MKSGTLQRKKRDSKQSVDGRDESSTKQKKGLGGACCGCTYGPPGPSGTPGQDGAGPIFDANFFFELEKFLNNQVFQKHFILLGFCLGYFIMVRLFYRVFFYLTINRMN